MNHEKSGIILIGNPGLGKSFSIPYHLWRFVRKDRTVVVYSSKSQTAWVFDKHQTYVQRVHDVMHLQEEIPQLSDTKTIFLWDPDESSHSEPPTLEVGVMFTHSLTHSPIIYSYTAEIILLSWSLVLINL